MAGSEWFAADQRGYYRAQNLGCFDECVAHMVISFTKEQCVEAIKNMKHRTKKMWRSKYRIMARYVDDMGWSEELLGGLQEVRRRWIQ